MIVVTTTKNRTNINLDTETQFCIQSRLSYPQQHGTWAAAPNAEATLKMGWQWKWLIFTLLKKFTPRKWRFWSLSSTWKSFVSSHIRFLTKGLTNEISFYVKKSIQRRKAYKSKSCLKSDLSPNAWEAQRPGWPTREALLQAQAQVKHGMNDARQHEKLTIPVDHSLGWSSLVGCSVTTSPIFFYGLLKGSMNYRNCSVVSLLMIKLA